jgi:small subunit ribosomal protein S17
MAENTNTQSVEAARGRPKTRIGTVLTAKMQKTVVVQVERRMRHGKYGKFMTEKKKYKCHDEESQAKPGDKVRIVETRPMSKEKRWRVTEVLVKSDNPDQPQAEAQEP